MEGIPKEHDDQIRPFKNCLPDLRFYDSLFRNRDFASGRTV